jgi:hypothetical protein
MGDAAWVEGGVLPLRIAITELDTLSFDECEPLRCQGALPNSLKPFLDGGFAEAIASAAFETNVVLRRTGGCVK